MILNNIKSFMKERTVQQCVKILLQDWNLDKTRPTYHYAFGIRKNKIIAIGRNKPEHPSTKVLELARTYNIEKWLHYPYFHAESDLITKLPKDIKPKQLEVLSIRINRHGQFRLAKPCRNCQKLLDSMDFRKIVWSCNSSEDKSHNLILQKQNKIVIESETMIINNLCSNLPNTSKNQKPVLTMIS